MNSFMNKAVDRTGPSWLPAFLAVAPVIATSLIGQAFTTPNLAPWYASLAKPPFTPPNWVFAPVWTTLYVLMAAAFWRILRSPAWEPGRRAAIGFFLVQLAFNAGWSIAFFGLHRPDIGLVVIAGLIVAISMTIYVFLDIDGVAASLLIPYLLWTSFATLLNASIWMLN